jgi:hypothetical protein
VAALAPAGCGKGLLGAASDVDWRLGRSEKFRAGTLPCLPNLWRFCARIKVGGIRDQYIQLAIADIVCSVLVLIPDKRASFPCGWWFLLPQS